jgi:hypothetical protein
MKRLFITLAFIGLLCSSAHAAVHRIAIVIGTNQGNADEVVLKYAETDAARIGGILRTYGGFEPRDVTLVTNAEADDVRRALNRATEQAQARGQDDTMLLVFYSGHADSNALHLRGTLLPLEELKQRVAATRAGAQILMLDACRSGAVTRVKGGALGPSFKIELEDRLDAKGLAVLTSSAAGEDSQESDELKASFFTHYLASGLIGAADSDRDGFVSVNEVFAYASTRTLAATASTVAGPQHPTYRVEMGGRQALILTAPGRKRGRFGWMQFRDPGSYIVYSVQRSRAVVAEIAVAELPRELTLPPGTYTVSHRAPDEVMRGQFDVTKGETSVVLRERMEVVKALRVASKGTTVRASAPQGEAQEELELTVTGGVAGDVLSLGIGGRVDVTLGWRILSHLQLEGRFSYANSKAEDALGTNQRHELGLHGALMLPFDFGNSFTMATGLEAGWLYVGQRFTNPSLDSRDGSAFVAGLALRTDIALIDTMYLRVDGAMLTYVMQTQEGLTPSVSAALSWRLGLGLGIRF